MIRNTKRVRGVLLAKEKGYYVDNLGNVYNKNNGLVNGYLTKFGYRIFSIRDKGAMIKVLFHQLVAYTKYGDKALYEGIHVRHLNGNPLDNSFSNIAIGSPSDNMMDKSEEMRIKCAKIATKVVTKYDGIASEIRKNRESGMNYKEIMKKYNISSKGTLSFIINKAQY